MDEPSQIGKCDISPAALRLLLEEAGLVDVMVDAFCNLQALDDARVSRR